MREIQWRRIHALARPGVLLDVGANVGETVIPPIREGLFTAALAAEPEAANFDRLCAAVRSADLGDKLACECCAIAEKDGEANLYVASHSKKHHLLRAGHEAVARKVRTVPAFTLDTWIAVHGLKPGDISAVKLDAQGWEGQILAGAPQLVAEMGIVWILEVSPKHLAAAGTPLPMFLAQLAASFTTAIDLRRPETMLPVGALPGVLADLREHTEHSYTNVVVLNDAQGRDKAH